MWPGPNDPTASLAVIGSNGCIPCCGREPTLRVRPKLVFTTEIGYVEFVCRLCGKEGGLSLGEDEARLHWDETP